ncbi:hypothetical protein IWX49DRAFT_552109 [Phyllosticta citricarpa]
MSFPLHFFPSSRAGRSSFYAPDLHIAGQPANSLATCRKLTMNVVRYASKQASMHACMHQASQPLSHPPTHPPSDRVARAATRPRTPSRYIGYIPDRPTDRPTDPASKSVFEQAPGWMPGERDKKRKKAKKAGEQPNRCMHAVIVAAVAGMDLERAVQSYPCMDMFVMEQENLRGLTSTWDMRHEVTQGDNYLNWLAGRLTVCWVNRGCIEGAGQGSTAHTVQGKAAGTEQGHSNNTSYLP